MAYSFTDTHTEIYTNTHNIPKIRKKTENKKQKNKWCGPGNLISIAYVLSIPDVTIPLGVVAYLQPTANEGNYQFDGRHICMHFCFVCMYVCVCVCVCVYVCDK